MNASLPLNARRYSLAAALLLASCGGSSSSAGSVPATRMRAPTPFTHSAHRRAPITSLDLANLYGLTTDERITMTSLQGLANAGGPRLILEPGGVDFWLTQLSVPINRYAHAWDLVGKYRSLVQGLVVYDTAVATTVNLATTMAGLQNLLVASPAVAATLQSTYGFPITVDLRGKFPDDLTAQTWAYTNLWPLASHSMVLQIDPTVVDMRDYAVANKVMVVSLHVGVAAEAALLGQMLNQMPPNSPYLGWFSTTDPSSSEVPSVRFLSQHGSYDVATSLFDNMTVWSQIPAPIATSQPLAITPPLSNKVYVTFTISDGDNLSYLKNDRPLRWHDPARGTIPMSWTVNPLLAVYAPAIFAYYQKTATPNDYIVTGPSGAGYAYPGLMPASAFNAYAQQMKTVFSQTGITVPFIQNDAPSRMLPPPLMATIENVVAPLGVEAFVLGNKPFDLNGQTPVGAARLIHTIAEAQNDIRRQTLAWNHQGPWFVPLYLNSWSLGVTDAVKIASTLGPDYQVVRGDQFFRLMRQAYGLPPR
jgi:hypothetical protein